VARGDKKKQTKGRRANYAPSPDQVGGRKYLPVGWSNWVGTILFGSLAIAVFIEIFVAISESRGADPVIATIMFCLLSWMTYLFATNRLKQD
jgi:hypothetical protein